MQVSSQLYACISSSLVIHTYICKYDFTHEFKRIIKCCFIFFTVEITIDRKHVHPDLMVTKDSKMVRDQPGYIHTEMDFHINYVHMEPKDSPLVVTIGR